MVHKKNPKPVTREEVVAFHRSLRALYVEHLAAAEVFQASLDKIAKHNKEEILNGNCIGKWRDANEEELEKILEETDILSVTTRLLDLHCKIYVVLSGALAGATMTDEEKVEMLLQAFPERHN